MGEKVVINPNFRCETVYSEFNTLLRRILDIHTKAKTKNGYSYPYDIAEDFEGLKIVLINILYQKTNIKQLMNENNYYLNSRGIDKALVDLDSDSKNPLYERFLSNIDELFNSPKLSFSFIFPVNLKIEFENDETYFNKILELFKIKKLKKNDLKKFLDKINMEEDKLENRTGIKRSVMDKPTKTEILYYLNRYPLILLVEIEARNSDFSERFAKSAIESFLGFLSFSDNFLDKKMLFSDYFRSGHHFNDMGYGEVIIFQQNRITHPENYLIQKLEREKRNIIEFKSYERFNDMANDLCAINIKFKELLNRAFFLYFHASSEKSVKYSFLNFWIIAETLIKAGKARPDDEVKSIMKYLIGDDILKKRIDFLDKKRNGIVHRGDIVEVNDRDLIKLIVDILIAILMKDMVNLKNINQLQFYLSNIKTKKNDIKCYLEALKLLNVQKSEDN